jgi:hypothetical protein
MKARIIIEDWQGSQDFVGVLMGRLLDLGHIIAKDEDNPDIIITNDALYLIGKSDNTVKIFVHCNPESEREEITKGVLSLTEQQVLARFSTNSSAVE